jgi:hypothetical protein
MHWLILSRLPQREFRKDTRTPPIPLEGSPETVPPLAEPDLLTIVDRPNIIF